MGTNRLLTAITRQLKLRKVSTISTVILQQISLKNSNNYLNLNMHKATVIIQI